MRQLVGRWRTAVRGHVPGAGHPWAGVVLLAAMLVTGVGWALSSPLESSPDEDYHLGSIWCPRPAQESCESRVIDGQLRVKVPAAVSDSALTCFAFDSTESAGCMEEFSGDWYRWTYRYDDGGYPRGYYLFHHMLISKGPYSSVMLMRVVNVLIAVGLVGAIGAAASPRLRRSMMLALAASWIPMGVYLIASVNPSSWAVTGLAAYTVGSLAATQTRGWRRWVLLGAAGVGALMCLACRYDAAFYLFVVSLALVPAVRWARSRWPEALFLAAFAALGVYWLLASGRTVDNSSSTSTKLVGTFNERLWKGILSAPRYFGGFFGSGWEPGWGDVPLDARGIPVLAIGVAAGVLLIALRRTSWRTWLSLLVVSGAVIGLPAVFFATGVFEELVAYQPRYILPLLAPGLFLLLSVEADDAPMASRPQVVALSAGLVVAHAMSLHTLLGRYVHGLSDKSWPLNLDARVRWWWHIPVSPMTVWFLTCCAAAVVLSAAVVQAGRSLEARDEPEAAAAAHSQGNPEPTDPGTAQ